MTVVRLVLPLLVMTAACTSASPTRLGDGRRVPYRIAATTSGSESASDALRVDDAARGYKPKVKEKRGRELAAKPPSAPGDPSTVESFRLGKVTLASGYAYSGTDPGPFQGTEEWVQVHLVAAGEHAPSAGGSCIPKDAYRWAVLVNADTGAVGMWAQGFVKGHC